MLAGVLIGAGIIAGIIGGGILVSTIRGLKDDYSYLNQDVDRFIDRHKK